MKTRPRRLRVIGGAHRGLKLYAPSGRLIRPTSNRVREALFDILGDRIVEAEFLDVYAGTGAVGIEALSRGARSAVFIERDTEAVGLMHLNLGLRPEFDGRTRIFSQDVAPAVAALESCGSVFDIVYADPPYNGAELDRCMRIIGRSRLLRTGSTLVVEHGRSGESGETDRLRKVRSARYGRAALTFYAPR